MIIQVLLEWLILGILLIGVGAFRIRNGVVGMAHLYHQDVKDRCVALLSWLAVFVMQLMA